MNKKTAEKYLHAIQSCKTKIVTCEVLSHYVGIYPEIIAQELTFFNPMVQMDPEFDLRDLQVELEAYVNELVAKEVKKEPVPIFKVEAKKYKGITDFVYKKLTINGLVNKDAVLSETDLSVLKVLIQNELNKNK